MDMCTSEAHTHTPLSHSFGDFAKEQQHQLN